MSAARATVRVDSQAMDIYTVRVAYEFCARNSSTIRYKITGGNFGDVFDVKETTGAIFVSGPLDYETRKKVGAFLRFYTPPLSKQIRF
uniref:Cadherin domain-containing protein n=1 Tax=Timema bartmani TaxID=61472 RepID=A0A7R9F0M7_9NEOP|nr:unnamed protein product [Timema bartmani]